MQLMPGTQRDFGVSDAFDPRQNVDAGVAYLRRLTDEFGTVLALAAYNAGPGAVRRYNGIPPYDETRAYVRAVLARGRPAAGGQGAPPDVLLRRDGQGDHEAAAGVGRGLQPLAEAAGRRGVLNERQIRVGPAGPPQAAADASPLVHTRRRGPAHGGGHPDAGCLREGAKSYAKRFALPVGRYLASGILRCREFITLKRMLTRGRKREEGLVRQANWRRMAGESPAEGRNNQPPSPRVMRRSL